MKNWEEFVKSGERERRITAWRYSELYKALLAPDPKEKEFTFNYTGKPLYSVEKIESTEKGITFRAVPFSKKSRCVVHDDGYSFSKLHRILYEYGFRLTNKFRINKVIFNGPATIVFWGDGEKTVVKCDPEDVFDAEIGLASCIVKRIYSGEYGYSSYNDVLRNWIENDGKGKRDGHIKKVIFNNNKTIVLWKSGEKTIVTYNENDIFDKRKGLLMAITKYAMGNHGFYYNVFKKYIEPYNRINETALIKALTASSITLDESLKNLAESISALGESVKELNEKTNPKYLRKKQLA